MIGIYKIINNINGKIYIGQSINIEKRIKEHFWKALCEKDISYNSILHQAIRKYGADNFDWEIIQECSIDEIDELEKYYISYYNSISPNGYNILSGGQRYRAKPRICLQCGKIIDRYGQSGLCKECYAKTTRIIVRPSAIELEKLLKENNFSKVGRMFNVSDNAIRKWCKSYGMSTKAKDYK